MQARRFAGPVFALFALLSPGGDAALRSEDSASRLILMHHTRAVIVTRPGSRTILVSIDV